VAEVIIAGWMDYSIHRDEVLGHLLAVGRATREEPGCLDYTMSPDADDPGRIRVFERWVSQEALDDHLTKKHVLDFRGAISGIARTDRSLHRFAVAGTESF
jgi:quinol monooxygenase YgiN